MQKLLLVLAVTAFIFSSCGTKKAEHKEGTHVHADGTVHEAHEHDAPVQEVFDADSVPACSKECSKDSCATKEACSDHKHDKEHDHDHDHGHTH